MLSPLQASARSVFLPRLAGVCRSTPQLNANVISRVGIRQSHAGTWAAQPARQLKKPVSGVFTSVSIATLGLGLAFSSQPTIKCDSISGAAPTSPLSPKPTPRSELPPPPTSSISLYELGFGTVAGFCAGVFTKKGLKAAAWFLGGIFVLLQYLGSQSLVRVDWRNVASRFESRFHTVDATGASRPPTVGSVWTKLINFLTADFQPRASFLAGFALGLRLG
ncbi:hypothetical protein D9611_004606 [Ephemerocybe angulata]|uniref:FUN14 family-domain-containing protein n=1 Tax=Ephemerocybe angulata TaxID=980116 RepID=A0A8H5EX98_9AGAR|nr:hypothetical protein D9611_004606 [Tulosesus angulatus]